jgi:hypothetical protein
MPYMDCFYVIVCEASAYFLADKMYTLGLSSVNPVDRAITFSGLSCAYLPVLLC